MTGKANDFYITAVLHQAFIAVDEEGTEAAAATAVVMRGTARSQPPVPFVVDRPFLFVIHDAAARRRAALRRHAAVRRQGHRSALTDCRPGRRLEVARTPCLRRQGAVVLCPPLPMADLASTGAFVTLTGLADAVLADPTLAEAMDDARGGAGAARST